MLNMSDDEKTTFDLAILGMSDFIEDLASLNCPKSAIEVLKIKQGLQKGIVTSETRNRWVNSYSFIEQELFENRLPQNYGKTCFQEFMYSILAGTRLMKSAEPFVTVVAPTYKKAMKVKDNILQELRKQKRILEKQYDVKDFLSHGSSEERTELFHSFAYSYVQLIEGIFDEIIRIYFF